MRVTIVGTGRMARGIGTRVLAGGTSSASSSRDEEAAKAVVARLASDGALRPVDVGPLERARQLEQIWLLGIMIQQPLGLGFRSGWKALLPRS